MKILSTAITIAILSSRKEQTVVNHHRAKIEQNPIELMRHPHAGSTLILKQLTPIPEPVRQFAEALKWGGSVIASTLDRFIPSIPMAGVNAASFEENSYTKGDGEENIIDFAKAVSKEFTVYSNDVALSQFTKKVIMVYGEDHRNIMLPSFRGKKGALLLEDPNPKLRCLEKYKAHKGNICKPIDLLDRSAIDDSFLVLVNSVIKLIIELDPNENRRFERKFKTTGIFGDDLLSEMLHFVDDNYENLAKSKTIKDRESLNKLKSEYDRNFKHYDMLVIESIRSRDAGMLMQAAPIIKQLDDDSTALLIVGARHAEKIYKVLSNVFPDHAVVLCFPNQSLRILVDKGMKSVLQGASKTNEKARSQEL